MTVCVMKLYNNRKINKQFYQFRSVKCQANYSQYDTELLASFNKAHITMKCRIQSFYDDECGPG